MYAGPGPRWTVALATWKKMYRYTKQAQNGKRDIPPPNYLRYTAKRPMVGLGLFCQTNAITATTFITNTTAFKLCISHRKNGLLNRLPEKVSFPNFWLDFVWGGGVKKPPNVRFECKTFYFMRKSIWNISESPGTFCIEQAQTTIGRSELWIAPPR